MHVIRIIDTYALGGWFSRRWEKIESIVKGRRTLFSGLLNIIVKAEITPDII